MTKKTTKTNAASKKPATRVAKDPVCKMRGCKVTQSAEVRRNANYTFRRGLCVTHYRQAIRAEREAAK
jgi:hypothetical protein